MAPASILKQERLLPVAAAIAVLFFFTEHSLLEMGKTAALIVSAALIAVIVLASTRVAHHAEVLASKVGDSMTHFVLFATFVMLTILGL